MKLNYKILLPLLLIGTILLSACGAADMSSGSSSGMATASATSSKKSGFGVLDSFSAQDLNGNPVDQSIFKEKKLTMVNVWATFCGPCINEMPDLGKLASEYSDKSVQIIGIPIDILTQNGTVDAGQLENAKKIVASTGVPYTQIQPVGELLKLSNQIQVVPTTIFVDENGNQVGNTFTGARSKEQWAAIIDGFLKEV